MQIHLAPFCFQVCQFINNSPLVQRKLSHQAISNTQLGSLGCWQFCWKEKEAKKAHWATEMQPSSYRQPTKSQQTLYSIHLALSFPMKYLQSSFWSTCICWWTSSVNYSCQTTSAYVLLAHCLLCYLKNWKFSFTGCKWLTVSFVYSCAEKMVLNHYLRDQNEKESKKKIIAERLQYEMTDFYLTH